MGLIVRNINFTGNFRGTFPQVPPPPPAPSDQYAQYTVLDLPGTGTNNSNNNVFIDSSANNFAITRFGNTTQGSFSPFSTASGYWSNYFDGSGDKLTIPPGAAFAYGTGAFTIEVWVNPQAFTSPYTTGVVFGQNRSGTNYLIAGLDSSYRPYFTWGTGGGGTSLTSSTAISLNTWSHIAWVREGTGTNQFKMYVNGVLAGTGTVAQDFNDTSAYQPCVGGYAHSAELDYKGYISNLRVVKGTAVYTNTFTPSTTPLTAVSGTSLLTCQSNRFIDNSANNFTITRNGDTSVSAFGPFAPASSYNAATMGGSMYFDGSGDYLTVPNNAAFEMGSDDFTVETYCYITSSASGTIVYLSGNNSSYAAVRIGISLGQAYILMSKSGSSWDVLSGIVGPNLIGQWAHIAVTRSSSTVRLFVNGTQVGTNYSISGSLMNSSNNVVGWFQGGVEYFSGFISNLRIVKGTALYTTNFTPPTAPVSAISGTSLLLNGTNAAIFDASTKNNLETVGNAVVSTTVSASGSMYFDNSSYLQMSADNTMSFTNGPFTIEAWIYSAASIGSTERLIVCQDDGSSNNQVFQLRLEPNTSNPAFYYWTNSSRSSAVGLGSGSSIAINTWTHVAVSYTGSTLYLFINGVQSAVRNVATMYSNSLPTTVGAYRNGAYAYNFLGYINNLRITKGIARYTANFTPPARS